MKHTALACAIGFWPFVFFSNQLRAQTYSAVVSDAKVYAFLQAIHTEDTVADAPTLLNQDIIPWDTLQLTQPMREGEATEFERYFDDYMYVFKGKASRLFTPTDKSYFYTQFTALRDSLWRRPFTGGAMISVFNPVLQPSRSYSVPLFSPDGAYALVRRAYLGPPAGGYGGVYLYRQTAARHWKLEAILNKWAR